MAYTPILRHVHGFLSESSDGEIVHAVDFARDIDRDLHGPSARQMLAECRRQWPNADYLAVIRHLLDNCPGVAEPSSIIDAA